MVAEFRKIWGIQESYQQDGNKYFKEKDRSKHTHHTIDAITIACMTKDKYDILAHAWTLEDAENIGEARKILADSKPWKTFKEDLIKIEEEILVSHYTPDNLQKQSKKIVRIRGKKQYVAEIARDINGKAVPQKNSHGKIIYKLDDKGNKIPIFKKGDTVRGSLHQDSIYGAIKNPLNEEEIRYVIRKDLESIKASDIENIVDETVKSKVKNAIEAKVLILSSNPKQKNKLDGNVWMNEAKQIPIHKVRIYANSVKNPLEIKAHVPLSKSKHKHKQTVYGQNDENYAMAIYEGLDKKGNRKREVEIINNMDAGHYFKLSNNEMRNQYGIAPLNHFNSGFCVKYILRKGMMVLMYEQHEEEIWHLSNIERLGRLYQITQLDTEASGIKLLFHQEAREKKLLTEFMGLKTGMKGGKNIDESKKFPWIKVSPNNFDCLVEGYDFKISPTGKIQKV